MIAMIEPFSHPQPTCLRFGRWLANVANAAFCGALRMLYRCPHEHIGFPRRGEDGIDYVWCSECGERLRSKIQFGRQAS